MAVANVRGDVGDAVVLAARRRLVAYCSALGLQVDERCAVDAVEPTDLECRAVDRDQFDDRGSDRIWPRWRAQSEGSGGHHRTERRLQYQITARTMHPVKHLNALVSG